MDVWVIWAFTQIITYYEYFHRSISDLTSQYNYLPNSILLWVHILQVWLAIQICVLANPSSCILYN